MCVRLGRALSGGMSRGLVCGAVAAGYLILGLAQGSVAQNQEPSVHKRTHLIAEAYAKQFEARCGSIQCKNLLGVDLSTKEGLVQAMNSHLFLTVCPKAVQDAAELLGQALNGAPWAEVKPVQTISSLANR